ncbi:MAG: metalloregulator ArsR/SmtB family transcription factor [Deltaproteobacteria bacterium]|nr:metalloregulator ArsR/SmtB family transcription factor [Deltaproteobacteria bacterium]
MRPQDIAKTCKCLSVDTRVRLLRLLGDQCLCVGALARRLGITPGAVSQHLRVLREAGLVIPEKRGYFVHYQMDRQALDRWLAALREAFGSQARCEFGPAVLPLASKRKGGDDV